MDAGRRAEACREEAAEQPNIHHSGYLSAVGAPGVSGRIPVRLILRNVTPVRRLLPYIKRYRRHFAFGFVCLVIASSVFAVVPLVAAGHLSLIRSGKKTIGLV